MADDELIFRGLNAAECMDFIRNVHKLAYNEGKFRDSQWMADRAAICFADNALVWYYRQPLQNRMDWELLCEALLTHYVTSNPATRPEPAAAGLPELTAPPVEVTSDGPSSVIIPGSISTLLCRVRVAAPGYIGYVSKAYVSGVEGRYGVLTRDPAEAMLVSEASLPSMSAIALKIAGSEKDGYSEFLCLAGKDTHAYYFPATWSGRLAIARQMRQTNSFSSNDDSTHNPGVVSAPWLSDKSGVLSAVSFFPLSWTEGQWHTLDCECSPETWKYFTNKFIALIGETPSGDKTLYFWSRKVWEDKDEQFVTEMYLERVA